MANSDLPHGLRPVRHFRGFPIILAKRSKISTEAVAIFQFDAVNRIDDNNIDSVMTPAGELYSGVSLDYGAASTATNHLVIEDPYVVFEAQDDDTTTGLVEADMGANANLLLTAGVAATSLISLHEIDQSTASTSADLDVHLLQKFNVPDNAYGPNCRVEILFNKHRMHGAAVGV